MIIKIYTDGAARGNPGSGGVGAVVALGGQVHQLKKYLGETTNNRAEYHALILALEETTKLVQAQKLEVEKIICYSDSELMVKQMKQEYKVKDRELGKLFVRVWNLAQKLSNVEYRHIRREKNKIADKLANEAIDDHDQFAPIV